MSDSQVPFATLGNAIGFVTKISGSVIVQSIDGQERVVKIGDPIFFGETIVTGANGSVTIAFIDGTEVVIGGDSIVEINDEIYNTGDTEDLVADSSSDIDALQEAILAGDDPTLIQEAPAAGEATGDQQDRFDVDIDRNDNSALPTFGNDTSSVLPTYGYDTNTNRSLRTTEQQYNAPESVERTTSESTFAPTSNASTAVAGIVTVGSITADDVINASEAASTIAVSGTATGGDISQGDQVVLVVNGTAYSTTVNAAGAWSVGVAGADLAADTAFDVVVTSSNSSGDTVQSVGNSTHTVDQSALLVNLDIDPITDDSTINTAESNSTVTVTGRVTGEAFNSGVVTLVINNVTYETAVNSDGTWSVDVAGSDLSADSDRIVDASVIVSNNINQQGRAESTEAYFVDTTARGSIRVDSITSDDVINDAESKGQVTVSGRVGFDASAGDTVSMTINGALYTTVVLANKTWSVEVSGNDLAAVTSFVATVTGKDVAGNPFTASTTSTHTVDLAADAGTVTVANITADDVINATEAAGTVAVTGTATGGDISEGDVVTMTINGKDYSTTVVDAAGNWTVNVAGADLAADTEFEVVVTSEDAAGNTVESKATSTHTVNDAPTATAATGSVTEDASITGTISADDVDLPAGASLTFSTTSTAEGLTLNADGSYSFDASSYDSLSEGQTQVITVPVTVEDDQGATATTTLTITVTGTNDAPTATADIASVTSGSGAITIDVLANDNDVDIDTLTITGATVPAEEGTVVIVDGKLEFTPAENFNGVATISYTIGDGNGGTDTADVKVAVNAVTINPITEDDVINATESAGTVSVTGTATGGDISEGDVVTMTINGEDYSTTVVDAAGNWTVNVAGTDLAADTEFEVVVTSEDAAGNTVESKATSTHTVDLEAFANIDIDRITSDSVINSVESADGVMVSITGWVSNDAKPGDVVTITLEGEVIGSALVSNDQDEQGRYLYSVDVLGSVLAGTALANPFIVATVTGTDEAGNSFEAESTEIYKVDTFADLDAFVQEASGDNVINFDEQGNVKVGGFIEEGGSVESIVITDSAGNSITITDALNVDVDSYFEKAVDVSALVDGELSITINVKDGFGNVGSDTLSIAKDTVATAGTVTVNPITEDDKIDGTELGKLITVSGTANGGDISVGDTVKMIINGKEYSTQVTTGGVWTLAVAGSDLAADSVFEVVVASSDMAGNTVESKSTSTHSVDLSAEASFSLAEGQQHVLANLPEGFTFPEGTTQVSTEFGGTISLVDGQYIYDAPVRDHSDDLADRDSITVSLPDGRTFTVNVDIEDSVPVAKDDENNIIVQRDTFEVSGIVASWTEWTNGTHVNRLDGDDNDAGLDQIRWGDPAGSNSQSGYGFVDNDANLNGRFELNEDINLGTFTHYNYPVYDGGAITAASMNVAFSLTDKSGVTRDVNLKVDFDHNETPNSDDLNASKDIVTVRNAQATFEWEGEVYTLQVVGFKDASDPNSPVVTSIQTAENAATSYELVVRVVEGAGYSLPETTGNVLDDNGLGADELSADGSVMVVGVASGGAVTLTDTNVGQTIHGQYGDLVLNDDGSYVYKVTAGVSSIPSGTKETFSYMIQDSDGSTSSATLSINVGTNTAPVARDDGASNSLFAGLVGEYYGTSSQLKNLNDFRALVDSKEPDATFKASNINYQQGSGDVASGTNLQTFLGSDASTLSTDPSENTDGGIHLQGYVYLAAGTYNFKVTADDGYQIKVNGEAVATIDHNQSANTIAHQSFTISESGYQAIDMIWWDQGGAYVFQPVLSADGGATYFVLDSSILSSTLTTSPEQSLVISADSLLANDTDADGDTLTVTSISNAQNGYAYMDSAGVIHFTPLQGFTGVATFDYTISDGRGGSDTATASIQVTPDGILPAVTVSTSETPILDVNVWKGHADNFASQVASHSVGYQGTNGSYTNNDSLNESLYVGDGNDDVVIAGNVNNKLELDDGNSDGDGDDNLLVKGSLNNELTSGAGNDSIEIKRDANDDINLSSGDDRLSIGGSVNSNSDIDLGDGNDTAYVAHDLSENISAGDGNDTVVIGGNVNSGGDLYLGSGDDTVLVAGNVYSGGDINLNSGNDVVVLGGKLHNKIDGGSGNDSIYLTAYTKSDYYNNVDYIKSRIYDFENIMMSDGIVKGNSSAFNNNSVTFSYSVSVDIDNTNSTTDSSIVTLSGIPATASLALAGVPLTANSDGSYDIEITSGQTTVDNLVVSSNVQLPDLEVTSTVSFKPSSIDLLADEDNYLVGTSGEDTLLGGAGDDILFGGNDQVSDTLTGGEGKDIFILNDTTDASNIDTITDFNAAEDALDLTDLLVGIEGSPGKDADADSITAFLTSNVTVTDGQVKIGEKDVANFGEESNFSSSDSIKVIYNDQEYNINIDG
ncbi:retention module-containing protein [Marinomonas hwangdonensis]|uniref:Retention module-containing protein n=1 Tax=Marinomonas hwangdonensis TaxID=1053647 RepID=A0A3M8Q7I0_9GAMM|nr:retention module-containing protein [Marinomonas hwangdonensis]RNF52003.1 retention module-containing protein [Marinomonas hwangdonensis]